MRVLHPPTLEQWTCEHRWKTTTSRPGKGDIVRVRYLTCRRCGLRVKTEERLAVPWTEQDLVALVRQLLPEGQAVSLRDCGIPALPLARLNALLERQGYVIHASKGQDRQRFVACTDQEGRVEQYGLFEVRPLRKEAPGAAIAPRRRGDSRRRMIESEDDEKGGG